MVKQRRGSRSRPHRTRRSAHVGFARLVDRAIASVPDRFRAALDGVAVVIAEWARVNFETNIDVRDLSGMREIE